MNDLYTFTEWASAIIAFFLAFKINGYEFGSENWPRTYPLVQRSIYFKLYSTAYGFAALVVYYIYLKNFNLTNHADFIFNSKTGNISNLSVSAFGNVLLCSIMAGLTVRGAANLSIFEAPIRDRHVSLIRLKHLLDAMSFTRIDAVHTAIVVEYIDYIHDEVYNNETLPELKETLKRYFLFGLTKPNEEASSKKSKMNQIIQDSYINKIDSITNKKDLIMYFVNEFGVFKFNMIVRSKIGKKRRFFPKRKR